MLLLYNQLTTHPKSYHVVEASRLHLRRCVALHRIASAALDITSRFIWPSTGAAIVEAIGSRWHHCIASAVALLPHPVTHTAAAIVEAVIGVSIVMLLLLLMVLMALVFGNGVVVVDGSRSQ